MNPNITTNNIKALISTHPQEQNKPELDLTHPYVQSNQRPHQLLQLQHQLQVRSDNFNSY